MFSTEKYPILHAHVYKGKYNIIDKNLGKALQWDLKNTPLEPYSYLIYQFFSQDLMNQFNSGWADMIRKDVRIYTDNCLNLAYYLRDLKLGIIKGKGWKITSKGDIASIYAIIEDYVLNRLEEVVDMFDSNTPFAAMNRPIEEWEKLFQDFPWRDSFNFEDREVDDEGKEIEDGWKHLSINEIEWLIKELSRFNKLAQNLELEIDTKMVTRFLEYMLDNGMPTSRKVGREVYKLLCNFNLIPDHIKRSHESNTSDPDPDGGYIKSMIIRIKENRGIK